MGRFVLIAGVCALAAAASCYNPSLVDCATQCETSHICADGLTCTSGYCRTAGATGTCPGSGSTMIDAPAGSACPPVPIGSGTPVCTTATPATAVMPQCFTVCTPAVGGSAADFHVNTWYGASIGSAGDETAAKTHLADGGGALWLGMHAPPGSGGSAADWNWTSAQPMSYVDWMPGQPIDSGAGGNCALLTGSGWKAEPCPNAHAFLIDNRP
jgi:hypothetical protein